MSAPLVIDAAAVKAVDDLTPVFIPSASGARLELSAELRAQAIVQTALDTARAEALDLARGVVVGAIKDAARMIALHAERDVYERRTAEAVLTDVTNALSRTDDALAAMIRAAFAKEDAR